MVAICTIVLVLGVGLVVVVTILGLVLLRTQIESLVNIGPKMSISAMVIQLVPPPKSTTEQEINK